MAVNILYFAWVKDKVGVGTESLTPPASVATVADLMDWLAARGGGYAAAFADRRLIKAAVDQEHVPATASVKNAREVAFFPPVTGG